MCSIGRYVQIAGVVLATGLLGACGEGSDKLPPGGGGVHAVNLDNGETRDFDAESLVPAGWAVCEHTDCAKVVSLLRCSMLGPGACLLNAECRLRLRCDIDIPIWMRPAEQVRSTTSAEDAAAPLPGGAARSAGYPVGCELVCSPKQKVSCEEIQHPNQCQAQPECAWETICYDEPVPGAGSGGTEPGQGVPSDARDAAQPACDPANPSCGNLLPPMPPPCTGVCRPSSPEPCEQLDATACERRDDCAWRPEPLPLFDADACAAPDCAMPYRPFCQPKVEPVCPEIDLARPGCAKGQELVEKFDAKGCLVGYACVPLACPPVDFLAPGCRDGEVPVEELDEVGCVIGMRCDPVACPPFEPPMPQCSDGVESRAVFKDGCLVAYECGPACTPPPPKPECPGSLSAVYRGICLAGWICSDPIDPQGCDELVASYNETLQAAKRCSIPTNTREAGQGAADFAPPEWSGVCSTTVPSGLGCSSCPTYVDPANREAIAKLNQIRVAFEKGQCFRNRACPAVMCVAPGRATCANDANGNGTCSDTESRPTY